jgi:hypothetical protein
MVARDGIEPSRIGSHEPDSEVELVDIVLRESERIPQHDHVLQCERPLGRDVLERCDRFARAQPPCWQLSLRPRSNYVRVQCAVYFATNLKTRYLRIPPQAGLFS